MIRTTAPESRRIANGASAFTWPAMAVVLTVIAGGAAFIFRAGAAPDGPPERRAATYVQSGITFSPNTTVKAPVAARDGEPSIRTDYKGNSYTGGIRGVPAGVDLWYFDLNPNSPTFDPNVRVPIYRGQPDGFTERTDADAGGDGGGDIDLAVGFPPLNPADQAREIPFLAYSSLTLANISTGRSQNRAETFELNPVGNLSGGPPGDDRQWHEFLGQNAVYLLYRTVAPAIAQVQRSNDGGFTYGATTPVGLIGQVGCLDVHQATGTVYAAGNSGNIGVGTPATPGAAPAAYVVRPAASDPRGVAHIFFVAKVADDGKPDGTLYALYSNQKEILLKSSTDKGLTWKAPVRVSPPDGPFASGVVLFPWMETGPTPGSVVIVWYGTPMAENNDNAQWKVYFAQSFNADTDEPEFRVAEVTEPEHFHHGSNISEMGLNPAAGTNRNLIDYFQVSVDPQGAAVIAYTDDHNDFLGNTFVARQISGLSLNDEVDGIIGNDNVPAPVEGAQLSLPASTAAVQAEDAFPPRQPGLNGEQVTDFELDVQTALLTRARTPDPLDFRWVRYDTSGTGESLAIAATMRVTALTSATLPAGSLWRASFAVNCPNSVLSADGTYTYGISDDGDQFFVQATTASDAALRTFQWGTAKRESDGSLTYTVRGTADAGEINFEDQTISIQVSVSKLNAVLSAANRPLITNGTVVAGLRAGSATANVDPDNAPPELTRQGRRDITRGGTQFVVYDHAFARPASTPAPTPLPPHAVKPGTTPAPTPPQIALGNIATRMSVRTGEEVGIAGFIVRGNAPKRLLIRAVGPSIQAGGQPLPGTLQNPTLEIRDSSGAVIASNDNWRGTAAKSQQAEITASGLAPTDDRESAVIVNLPASSTPKTYTAVLSDTGITQGIGVIEVYDLDAESFADLGNISTRGFVGTADDVMIGGVIVRDTSFRNRSQDIVLRGIGPSLSGSNIANPVADPQLTLFDTQGNTIAFNDDFATNAQGDIAGSGLVPAHPKEAAIRRILAPGLYTVMLNGANGGTGVGLVEAYNLGNQ